MKLCQKKRRNVRWSGCMRDLKGVCGNVELRRLKRRDVYSFKSERLVIKEPQNGGRNCDGIWGEDGVDVLG